MRLWLFIGLVLSFLAGLLNAQNMHISHYSQEKGLPFKQVNDVAYDRFGFLWIAGNGGLLRFDGQQFTDYSKFLPSAYVRYFCATEKGLLVSHDGGISLIQSGLDSTQINLFKAGAIDPDDDELYYPSHMLMPRDGSLWVGQAGGRIRIFTADGKNDLLSGDYSEDDPGIEVYFSELRNGKIVVAFSSGGLYVFDHELFSLNKVAGYPLVNGIRSVGNEIWLNGEHLYRLVFSEEGDMLVEQEIFHFPDGVFTSLARDQNGNIYTGIQGKGLFLLDDSGDQAPEFIRIFSSNNPHRVDELPFQTIHNIVIQADNLLWICSEEGLGVLQRRFFESIGSIPNANASALCISEMEKVFVNFGDVYVLEPTNFGYTGSPLPPFSNEPVTALTSAGSHLWAGTSTGNLIKIDQKGRKIISHDLDFRGEGIYHLLSDSHDRLWVCQAPEEDPIIGIGCILPDGKLKEYGKTKGLFSRILAIRETNEGRIYATGIGESTYLYRYMAEEDEFINLSLPLDFQVSPDFEVHDLAVDKQGAIWLASTNGLLRYDMDRIQQVDLGEDFTQMEFRAVIDMPDGSIWASTDTDGILRYGEDKAVIIREESGLPSKVMSYRCLVRDHHSRLWAGTAEGIVYSQMNNPKPRESNKPLLLQATVDSHKRPVQHLSLHEDQDLRIRLVSAAYHGYPTYYQFRVNDGRWSTPGTERELDIPALEPGDSRLQFRSRHEGAFLWSEPEQIELKVQQQWFRNPLLGWILGSVVLLSLILLSWFWKNKYHKDIDKLSQGLRNGEEILRKREEDLQEVRKEISVDHRQIKTQMIGLEIMHRMITKITPGMKWDSILEIISIDLLKFPGVIAFEIGIHEGNSIAFEGYSERIRNFTSENIDFNPASNLAAFCMKETKPLVLKELKKDANHLLDKWDKRLSKYESSISVPFFLGTKQAVFSIYSDKAKLFDDYALKAMAVFATYLEQIHGS